MRVGLPLRRRLCARTFTVLLTSSSSSRSGRPNHSSRIRRPRQRVAPLEASSGQRTRHRLSRAGDRDLNRALHTVAITRLRCHDESRAYETKRAAQGKTHRDVRRSLKRAPLDGSTAASRPPPTQPPRSTASPTPLDKHRSVQRPAAAILPEEQRPFRAQRRRPQLGRRRTQRPTTQTPRVQKTDRTDRTPAVALTARIRRSAYGRSRRAISPTA